MKLEEVLDKYKDKNIELYVDMDGVIADYIVGEASHYDNKRPLYSSIKKLEEISKMTNINMHILSITRMTIGRDEKNIWLDKYASFFKKDNRHIISKEENPGESSSNLKLKFLDSIDKNDKVIVLIDDDPKILHAIKDHLDEIILLKDTCLVD